LIGRFIRPNEIISLEMEINGKDLSSFRALNTERQIIPTNEKHFGFLKWWF
jgi:hypothetical protein